MAIMNEAHERGVVVPNKIKRRRLPIQEFIAITTGFLTFGLLINALVK